MNTQIRRPAFELDLSGSGGAAVTAQVSGEIDVTNAAEFARSMEGLSTSGPVILDLRGLQYLDSAGFAVVYRLLGQGLVVVVLAPDSPIHPAATLVGLPFHESIEAAVSSL